MKNTHSLFMIFGLCVVTNLHAVDLDLKLIGAWPGSSSHEIMLRRGSHYSYGNPSARGVAISGDYAYLADGSAGLQVIDVCNPAMPRKLDGYYQDIGTALGVSVSGYYAYLGNGRAGLEVMDIRDPAHPLSVGRYGSLGYYWAGPLVVAGDLAYVLSYLDDPFSGNTWHGLYIIDISDPANPAQVGSYATSRFPTDVAVSGNYAYVTEDSAGLEIIDITNPANPSRAGGYDTNRYPTLGPEGVAVSGRYAYLADGWAGLIVIDVSDPANPRQVGSHLTRTASSGWAVSVTLSSNICYVVDRYTGLHVMDVSDPTNPRRLGCYDTSGEAFSTAVAANYAYVADGTNGLQIIAIPPATNSTPDRVRPVLTIITPKALAHLTTDSVTVSGKTSDNVGATRVVVRVENARGGVDCVQATGTSNWTALVSHLAPGLNTLRVHAQDAAGNISEEVTRSFTFVVLSPVSVTIEGQGSVTPALNGQLLEIGRTYAPNAKPSAGYLFVGWTGDIQSSAARLTFLMQSNLSVRATFIPNPFLPLGGTYYGLFYPEQGARHDHSGLLTASVTRSGAFSAKIILGGESIRFSGYFSLEGRYTTFLTPSGTDPLSVELHLEDNETMTGTITGGAWHTGGTWQAALLAERPAMRSAAVQEGKYTIVLPGSNVPSAPGGDSVGTLRTYRRGTLTFTAHLADGARVVQQAPLLSSKRWPLYAPLYGGAGSTLGWIEFAERETDDLHGVVIWSKPPLPGEQFYPAGFVLRSEATGSRYRPLSEPINLLVSFTSRELSFSRGDLVEPFINSIVLTARRQVANLSSNRLTMTFITDRGLFRGSVTTPGEDRMLPFTGVLHQKADLGTGFVLGTNLSGLVQLNAAAKPVLPKNSADLVKE